MSAVLVINGTTINRSTTRTTLLNCRPIVKDGYPTLSFARCIDKLTSGMDPWDAQTVTLTQDGVLIFAGDTGSHFTHMDERLGWVREWTCYGLAKRAEYIPVTDSLTLTDTARFNLPADDPDYLPSRAGRTMGQIVADVLEMPENKTPLASASIGNYSSSGTGAAATCTISAGVVQTTFTITAGGSGYTAAPTVIFSGGGGSGAAATAGIAAGAVTSLTRTAGGSGYTSAPIMILSTLPSVTITDLNALTIIPPFEVDVAGERILQSLEGCIQAVHPNHFVTVDCNGYIRVFDPRTWTPDVPLTMDGSDPRVGKPAINADWSNCYTRVTVRGSSLVVPVTLSTQQYPGSQTATGTAVRSGTTLGSITLGSGGSGYNFAPAVSITGGGGSGATATATETGGVVTGYTVTAAGSGYTSTPTVTVSAPDGGLAEDFAHDGLTNAQAKANWQATDFTTPSISQGTATGSPTVASGVITAITVNQPGYNYTSAPSVLITDSTGSGATATATISGGAVTGITVTAGGTGYSSSPTITVAGPAVGQSDVGTCTMGSTTSVTVTSSNAAANWPAGYWDYEPGDHQGVIVLRSDTLFDVTQFFTARIIANASLSAGGTCVLTIDSPAPATSYNSYQIYGTAGGASYVYRRYQVTNAQIAAQMGNYFPYPVPYVNSDGTSATLVSTPCGTVFSSTGAERNRNLVRSDVRDDPDREADGARLFGRRRDAEPGREPAGVRAGEHRRAVGLVPELGRLDGRRELARRGRGGDFADAARRRHGLHLGTVGALLRRRGIRGRGDGERQRGSSDGVRGHQRRQRLHLGAHRHDLGLGRDGVSGPVDPAHEDDHGPRLARRVQHGEHADVRLRVAVVASRHRLRGIDPVLRPLGDAARLGASDQYPRLDVRDGLRGPQSSDHRRRPRILRTLGRDRLRDDRHVLEPAGTVQWGRLDAPEGRRTTARSAGAAGIAGDRRDGLAGPGDGRRRHRAGRIGRRRVLRPGRRRSRGVPGPDRTGAGSAVRRGAGGRPGRSREAGRRGRVTWALGGGGY